MKQHRNLIRSLTVCAVVLALVSTVAAQGAAGGAAKVIRVHGSARFTTGNFVWQPIKVGEVLHAGTIVQTSADEGSYVDLVLGDGNAPVPQALAYHPSIVSSMAPSAVVFRTTSEQNVVRIWGDSALGLDRLMVLQTGADMVTETQLDLKRGRITGNVKKLSAASKYEVKLPSGVAAVRGTLFDLQAVGIVKVYIGSMAIAWVDPKTQNVTTQTVLGGQSYDVASNQVSILSGESRSELEELSSALLVAESFNGVTTLASDRTLVGMSPVGGKAGAGP